MFLSLIPPLQSYHNHRDRFKVESNSPTDLVAKAAENIEKLLLTRSQALKVDPLSRRYNQKGWALIDMWLFYVSRLNLILL